MAGRKWKGLNGREIWAPELALASVTGIAVSEFAAQHTGLESVQTSPIIINDPASGKEGGEVPHVYKSQTMRWTVVLLMLLVLALVIFEIATL